MLNSVDNFNIMLTANRQSVGIQRDLLGKKPMESRKPATILLVISLHMRNLCKFVLSVNCVPAHVQGLANNMATKQNNNVNTLWQNIVFQCVYKSTFQTAG